MRAARVSNNLRRLRFEFGEMTQQELAEQVDVTRQTIIAIEGEKYSPSLELAFRIATAFGKPLEEVFQYEGGSPRRRGQTRIWR
jgi:putative transcriptional regulator